MPKWWAYCRGITNIGSHDLRNILIQHRGSTREKESKKDCHGTVTYLCRAPIVVMVQRGDITSSILAKRGVLAFLSGVSQNAPMQPRLLFEAQAANAEPSFMLWVAMVSGCVFYFVACARVRDGGAYEQSDKSTNN